jgi:hypothetical protein
VRVICELTFDIFDVSCTLVDMALFPRGQGHSALDDVEHKKK